MNILKKCLVRSLWKIALRKMQALFNRLGFFVLIVLEHALSDILTCWLADSLRQPLSKAAKLENVNKYDLEKWVTLEIRGWKKWEHFSKSGERLIIVYLLNQLNQYKMLLEKSKAREARRFESSSNRRVCCCAGKPAYFK